MKKLFIIIGLIFVILNFSGCYDYTELKDYTIVMGIGFDKGEKYRYRVSAELDGISGNSDEVRESQTSIVIHSEANSIPQAIANLTDTTGGELYFKSCEITVIGNELCRDGCDDIIEYLLQSTDFQMKLSLAVANGKASEIFAVKPTVDNVISIELLKSIKTAKQELSSSRIISPYQAFNLSARNELVPLPLLTVKDGKPVTVNAGGLTLLKDGKTAKKLSTEDSVCLNFIDNEIERAIIECGNSGYEITRCSVEKENDVILISATALPLDESLSIDTAENEIKKRVERTLSTLHSLGRNENTRVQVCLKKADK